MHYAKAAQTLEYCATPRGGRALLRLHGLSTGSAASSSPPTEEKSTEQVELLPCCSQYYCNSLVLLRSQRRSLLLFSLDRRRALAAHQLADLVGHVGEKQGTWIPSLGRENSGRRKVPKVRDGKVNARSSKNWK